LVAPAGIESREDHVVDIKGANTMETFWCSIIAVAVTGLMATTATAQVQSWDKQFPNQNRSRLLGQFGNAGVFDHETGLVWEKSPSSNLQPWSPRNPDTAHILCNVKAVGNRLGWRLPTIQSWAVSSTRPNPNLR